MNQSIDFIDDKKKLAEMFFDYNNEPDLKSEQSDEEEQEKNKSQAQINSSQIDVGVSKKRIVKVIDLTKDEIQDHPEVFQAPPAQPK